MENARAVVRDSHTGQLQDSLDLERMRVALASSGDVVYDCVIETGDITWGDGAEAAFEVYETGFCTGRNEFLALIDEGGRRDLEEAFQGAVLTGEPYSTEYRVQTRSGAYAWIEDRASVLVDDLGQPVRIIGMLRFVTRRKEHEAHLLHLATRDDLTGHLNRDRLLAHVSTAIDKYWLERKVGGLIITGIDNLAMLNQNFGFEVADKVIIEVGKRLQDSLCENDILGRVAGNKFGIILDECSSETLVRCVNRLKNAVRDTVIYTQAGPVSVTTSMGVVSLPFGCKSGKDALAHAEEALSHAKTLGSDKVHFYEHSEETENARRQKLAIGNQIMAAMNEDRLSLFYQPIIDTKTGKPGFYECLIRIIDEQGGVIPAGHFIPVAEELGLIRALDRKVVDMAIQTLHEYPDIHLAVNVSGLTATDPSWFEEVIKVLRENQSVASRMTVEITETVALQEIRNLTSFLASLRELGCKIAIDDFGAGYTSYRNLQSLDVDLVKIDGSFVRGITECEDSQFFVRALIDLAQKFGLETVAEWVETEEEVEMLGAMGVEYLQGFHLGRPATKPVWPPKILVS